MSISNRNGGKITEAIIGKAQNLLITGSDHEPHPTGDVNSVAPLTTFVLLVFLWRSAASDGLSLCKT